MALLLVKMCLTSACCRTNYSWLAPLHILANYNLLLNRALDAKASYMRIGELAGEATVSVETVRYYQRRGLLDIPERPYGENRIYVSEHLDRLRFIKRAQALGFSLSEVESLLSLSASNCAEAEQLANRKLMLVNEKLADLSRIQSVLKRAVAGCRSTQPYEGCPIIESLIDPKA
ncbi:MAG: MerR family mercuric resistance operon transcriptional regulator [Zhongshania sp.]|jgi:MerR family mercuric resistance operon transcriptional regulator